MTGLFHVSDIPDHLELSSCCMRLVDIMKAVTVQLEAESERLLEKETPALKGGW